LETFFLTPLRADISAVLTNAGSLPRDAQSSSPAPEGKFGPGQRRRQKNQHKRPGSAETSAGKPAEAGAQGAGDDRPRKPRHRAGNADGTRAGALTVVPDLVPEPTRPRDSQASPRATGRAAAASQRPAATGTVWAAATEHPAPDATFASLGVPEFLVAALAQAGITTPFPIQAATLPDALAGRDILGRAQTGSGKTLGFSLPLVARLSSGVTAPGRPRGLVLVPTRELATQVADVLVPLAEAMGLRVATIFGGVSYRPQIAAMNRRTDIVVACPGRLWDIIEQGVCDLGDVEITVLDEADHMADLGFLPTVRRLLDGTPAGGQRLLFSATLDGAVDVLAKTYMTRPVLHSVDDSSTPAAIEHRVFTVTFENRNAVLADLVSGDNRSLVFTRTKHGAEKLAKKLTEAGIPATDLHGNLSQAARARNLAKFSAGHVRVLVATDVAARGIHVDGVDLVIHADPPAEHKAYTHRSGRTARGGASGTVITVQTKSQSRDVSRLMRDAGVTPASVQAAEPGSNALREIAGPPAPPPVVPPEAAGGERSRKGRRGGSGRGSGSGSGRGGFNGSGGGSGGWSADGPRRPRRARQDEESWRPGSSRGRSGQIGSGGGHAAGKRREHTRGAGS
jgi:superfamily II DNA/RNA helicase